METYSINRWYNITYEYLITGVYNRIHQPSCLNLSEVHNIWKFYLSIIYYKSVLTI
jgi:hypothetical protein